MNRRISNDIPDDATARQSYQASRLISGSRVAIIGRLAALTHASAADLLKRKGFVVVEPNDPSVEVLVLGEWDFSWTDSPDLRQHLANAPASKLRKVPIVTETELWQALGMLDAGDDIRRWFTPAMLADLIGVPTSCVRRWYRQGLLRAARVVHRLPYFDFSEAAAARRLALLRQEGFSLDAITQRVRKLLPFLPSLERNLSRMTLVADGRRILLRRDNDLIDPAGQLHFDFETQAEDDFQASPDASDALQFAAPSHNADLESPPADAETLAALAEACDDEGRLAEAVEHYRAAIAAGGLTAELSFQLGDTLYRLGDLAGARERFWTAIELDDGFVEARLNLGAVLTESGDFDLAEAAFRGVLTLVPDYPDAHYLLAKLLREMGRLDEAEHHRREFVRLAPHSPWANETGWNDSPADTEAPPPEYPD
ncbi:tetratricopeptide repeat protein [Thermopirellula anaerolimosa]